MLSVGSSAKYICRDAVTPLLRLSRAPPQLVWPRCCYNWTVQMPGDSCCMLHADLAALCRRSALCLSPYVTRRFQLQSRSTREVPYTIHLNYVTHAESIDRPCGVSAGCNPLFPQTRRPQRENRNLYVRIFLVS
jgi:hypothetical protein